MSELCISTVPTAPTPCTIDPSTPSCLPTFWISIRELAPVQSMRTKSLLMRRNERYCHIQRTIVSYRLRYKHDECDEQDTLRMLGAWVVNSASCLMVSHIGKRIFGASLTRLSASGHFFLASASLVVASISCLPKLSWSLVPVKTYFVTNFGRRSNKRCLESARRRQLLCWSRSEMRRVRLKKLAVLLFAGSSDDELMAVAR